MQAFKTQSGHGGFGGLHDVYQTSSGDVWGYFSNIANFDCCRQAAIVRVVKGSEPDSAINSNLIWHRLRKKSGDTTDIVPKKLAIRNDILYYAYGTVDWPRHGGNADTSDIEGPIGLAAIDHNTSSVDGAKITDYTALLKTALSARS